MGGVATDATGRSSVRGLWVVGEAASTGLHGANRLASNSLLEAAVLGLRAAGDIAGRPAEFQPVPTRELMPEPADTSVIRPIVSRYLSVLRDGDGLDAAIALLLPMLERGGSASDPALVALLIATFAKLRRESRGAHARTDFAAKLPVAERRFLTMFDAAEIAGSLQAHPLARSA
jgi:L-aspartate oxidase